MKVFNALFAELHGVFGKAYLFAGLLPSFALVFLATWYWSGKTAAQLITGIASIEDSLGDIVAPAFLVVALGLVFFAARGWILDFVEAMPGRRLRRAKDWLVRRQLVKRFAAERDLELQRHHRTIVDKWVTELDLNQPKALPSWECVPKAQAMRRASAAGVRVFAGLRANGSWPPTGRDLRRMLAGLRSLYAYSKDHYETEVCKRHICAWRIELQAERSDFVLMALQDHAHRNWADSKRARDDFPDDDKWVGPTRLGTRSAALDDYAEQRYGMDTSRLLSRLSGVLNDDTRLSLADSRLSVETLLNLGLAMLFVPAIVMVKSAAAIAQSEPGVGELVIDTRGMAFVVAALIAAKIFYGGALYAFRGLAEKTMRAVDLNRLNLVKRFGFDMPADMEEERKFWKQMASFLSTGSPIPDFPLGGSSEE